MALSNRTLSSENKVLIHLLLLDRSVGADLPIARHSLGLLTFQLERLFGGLTSSLFTLDPLCFLCNLSGSLLRSFPGGFFGSLASGFFGGTTPCPDGIHCRREFLGRRGDSDVT